MKQSEYIFSKKKILIYGLGKSGVSSFKFLKDKAELYLFDDNLKTKKKLKKSGFFENFFNFFSK